MKRPIPPLLSFGQPSYSTLGTRPQLFSPSVFPAAVPQLLAAPSVAAMRAAGKLWVGADGTGANAVNEGDIVGSFQCTYTGALFQCPSDADTFVLGVESGCWCLVPNGVSSQAFAESLDFNTVTDSGADGITFGISIAFQASVPEEWCGWQSSDSWFNGLLDLDGDLTDIGCADIAALFYSDNQGLGLADSGQPSAGQYAAIAGLNASVFDLYLNGARTSIPAPTAAFTFAADSYFQLGGLSLEPLASPVFGLVVAGGYAPNSAAIAQINNFLQGLYA